jgi:hypothetical protein
MAETVSDKAWVVGSALFSNNHSTLRLDNLRNNNSGTVVSMEGDLGLADNSTLPDALGGLRIGKRWRVEFEYLHLDRVSSAILHRTITAGATTYDAGGEIAGSLASTTYRFALGYSVLRRTKGELGVTLGGHITKFNANAARVGIVKGKQSSQIICLADPTAPLPTIGLYGNYKLGSHFVATGRVDFLDLKIDDYKGKLVDVRGTVAYRPIHHMALGTGYQYVEYDISAQRANFDGEATYQFNGPIIFAELDF